MRTIHPPGKLARPVYRAELVSHPEAIDQRIAAQKTFSSDDVAALKGDLVEVDEPLFWDLKELAEEHGAHPTSEIAAAMASEDFWLIQFALAVLPAPGNTASWARFRVKLRADAEPPAAPVAYSLLPHRARKARGQGFGIGRDFRFQSSGDSDLIVRIELDDQDALEITGAGLSSAAPSWDVRGTDVRGSLATYAVVRKHLGAALDLEFDFYVKVTNEKGAVAATPGEVLLGGKSYRLS